MTAAIGFLIAVAIAVTGVGGGTITVPVLILFLHVPPARTVGTALAFAAVVKLLVAPVCLFRRQVRFRTLGLMLAGGLPGVLVGVWFIPAAERSGRLTGLIGVLVIATALLTILRTWITGDGTPSRDRSRWMPWLMLPVGVEMGFSSAGAGAVGSLALQNLTRLDVGEVAGTNILFGLVLALVGGGLQMRAGSYDPAILAQLAAGGVLGGVFGSAIANWLPPKPLRLGLCLWLASLGGVLCWHAG
jgi:uncharacterized protein